MPLEQKWVYTCPITGAVVMASDEVLPDRWARIATEVYSPNGMFILAHRILKHSEAPYSAILSAPYPSTAYDDWQLDLPSSAVPEELRREPQNDVD